MNHFPSATSGGTLRERFIADMTVRGLGETICKDYLSASAAIV